MSNKRFIVVTFFLSFIVLGTFFFSTSYASATLFGTKWSVTNSSGAVVKVRDSGLPANYTSAIAPGIAKWNNSAARMTISNTTSVGAGTISFISVSKASWNQNGWGVGEAWAQALDLSGVGVCSPDPRTDPSINCTKVDSGVVYVNAGNVSSSSDRRAAVVAHEIGHIVGLAHRRFGDIKSSIMCNNLDCTYDVQSYDVNNINSLY